MGVLSLNRVQAAANTTNAACAATTSKERNVSRADQKLSTMVIVMCLFSVVEHVFVITMDIYPFTVNISTTSTLLAFVEYFAISLKHAVNFFLFYTFNTNFKKVCLKYLRMRTTSDE
jgi:hypothetical protein